MQIWSFLASSILFPCFPPPIGQDFNLCQIWPQASSQASSPDKQTTHPYHHHLLLQPPGTIWSYPNRSYALAHDAPTDWKIKSSPKHHPSPPWSLSSMNSYILAPCTLYIVTCLSPCLACEHCRIHFYIYRLRVGKRHSTILNWIVE